MFKLESYITPILLSYVDKYIKNFRPEDSQVSLWGGDASFHNLDLRLEVLEQELHLPFSFVSGHIHELLIHVPWTKLASEPITITINTIECILKLRGAESAAASDASSQSREKSKKSSNRKQEIETPPGYVQSLVNKIVSNIRIYCNNLILKYVEEDIVLSMNVKLLTFESANEKWEAAYTELSPAQVTLRKLITINDLTVCLDKRNASGKIDVYQEPMLYRCSMVMHLLRNYHSATAKRASTTRLDISCNSMEFSMNEQQVPMLMRLVMLLMALQQKQLKPENEVEVDNSSQISDTEDTTEVEESWAGWAWSFVPSILPVTWDEEWNREQQTAYSGHTMQIGFYVDIASLTFKVSESSNDRGYYSQRKLKYWPILSLNFQGVFIDIIMHGIKWLHASFGISQAVLLPIGYCTCSHVEIPEGHITPEYLKMGLVTTSYKADSLFDVEAVENKGQRRSYNIMWDYHTSTITEAVMLERSPAFAVDYIYQLEIPDDMTSERLSELGSDLEYSNLSEKGLLRIVVGPFRLRLCSGFFHRINSLKVAASAYDYPPYSVPKVEPSRHELLPPSEDDYDALNNYIPWKIVQITVFAPVFEFHLMDHPHFEPFKGNLFKKRKKLSLGYAPQNLPELPKVTLECQCLDVRIQYPIYVKRLVQTTCQLPDPPRRMFEACHTDVSVKVIGFCSRLILSANRHTTMITPCGAAFHLRTILKPEYWTNPDVPHKEILFESESISVTGTKAKIMIVTDIIDKLLKMDTENSLGNILNSSLLSDAARGYGLPYLEFCVEGIRFKKVTTRTTITLDMSLGSIKICIFEPIEFSVSSSSKSSSAVRSPSRDMKTEMMVYSREIQQVLFISGPEFRDSSKMRNLSNEDFREIPLFTMTVQYPMSPDDQPHPSIIAFSLQEIQVCVDPLFCKWLQYTPRPINKSKSDGFDSYQRKGHTLSETSGSILETPRRVGTPHESIHSSSDREHISWQQRAVKTVKEDETIDFQEKIYNFLKTWFNVWKGVVLSGDVSQCTVYFPVASLSAVGSQGIQQAVQETISKEFPPDILVLTLPNATIRNASQKKSISSYINELPVKLPENIWSPDKSTFPWTVTVSNLSCYTLQYSNKLNFLKPLNLSATVGMSTKPSRTDMPSTSDKTNEKYVSPKISKEKTIQKGGVQKDNTSESSNDISSLGVCVHIDMSPIALSISEVQIRLIASILFGLTEVFNNVSPKKSKETPKSPDTTPLTLAQTPAMSPTLLRESTVESLSERSTTLSVTTDKIENDDVKLTAWIQWTVARFSIELLSHDTGNIISEDVTSIMNPKLKLVIDAEDLVSSLDFQNVYLKIKSKISSASVRHYRRNKTSNWKLGPYLGVTVKARDDSPALGEHQDDTAFASITVTRASCSHTHSLWGAVKKSKKKDSATDLANKSATSHYITEIVINIQPIDFIISLKTLYSFYVVLEPLMNVPTSDEKPKDETNILMKFNNRSLPLAYVECRGIRIIMPASELGEKSDVHDVCMFQIGNFSLTPAPVNPICRVPCRPDIYQQAAQARILNIPGSEVEDRQYQMDITGISMRTGTWREFDPILNSTAPIASNLRTMNENPALEWNNLEKGSLNLLPHFHLLPIIERFDLSVIFAPAMMYKSEIVICGHSVEVNFTSDIDINIALHQIKLASALTTELMQVGSSISFSKRPKIVSPYPKTDFSSIIGEDELEAESTDFTRDSGIDTDIKSLSVRTKPSVFTTLQLHKTADSSDRSNPLFPRPPNPFPHTCHNIDVLFTGGKIICVLYKVVSGDHKEELMKERRKSKDLVKESETGYEASEEGSIDEKVRTKQKRFAPLLYISASQPNAYLSRTQLTRKVQLSCFDFCIKISGTDYIYLKSIPSEQDYPISLLETKSGSPHPVTGVLPSFFTLKYGKGIGKPPTLDIEFARPTKLLCSLNRWSYLIGIKEMIEGSFKSSYEDLRKVKVVTKEVHVIAGAIVTRSHKFIENYSKFKEIKDKLFDVTFLNVQFSQIVFVVKTDSGSEVSLSFGKLKNHLAVCSRPEKITNNISLDCLTLGVSHNGFTRLLLNPWSVSVDICLFWESWQNSDSDPQVQISFESDCLTIDISPQQIDCLNLVVKELTEFVSSIQVEENLEVAQTSEIKMPIFEREQHYKDDLRAGAFQFVDSTTNNVDELPLPYQVVFWSQNIAAMAWRYPQPRALTKVRVFPVPFKISTGNQEDQQVLCHLEYWSECHGSYQSYTQFYLSESEMCHLDLPEGNPQPAVACTWRVVLSTPNYNTNSMEFDHSRVMISPRALAACMRIDSYFNKALIPNITTALHLSKINISLYSHFDKTHQLIMPEALKLYNSDLMFPESQCFLTLTFETVKAYLACWNFKMASFDVSTTTQCSVLDYGYLTQQTFIEPFESKLELNISKNVNISFLSKLIHVKFDPCIAHTLAVNAQLWEQSWRFNNDDASDFIVVTHYVICNDTNVNLRFGQAATEEDILLPSRYCHLYCWRSQKYKQMIRVGLEENGWLWSRPFIINENGTQMCQITSESNLTIVVTIKSLSTTQKQVIFSGQLIVCNMLLEHFEMKVVKAVKVDKDKEFKYTSSHIISGKSKPPSLLIDSKKKYFLRLRFFGLESAWSGDIPLMENTKCAQPWLVKVPLQERGQFLSIWCRIIVQEFQHGKQILTMLWPLFMIRSNLPVNAKMQILTPTLNVHLESAVKGKGEIQQLYCPGTIDHSHQLSFQLDSGTPTSNPYVPLNYSLVDQRLFFRKGENENINDILKVLNSFDVSKWPYFGEDYDDIEWIIDDQPLTHVQVRYQNACHYSSSLLVELLPWCLLINTLGCPIAIIIDGRELCRVSHHGLVTPPKLEETFHIGVGICGTWNVSPPLQLAKSDWSQTFYMPTITGTIPLEGSIKTAVKCGQYICMVSINSGMSNEIRLLKISSTHVLTNRTTMQVEVICFAVPDNGNVYNIPKNVEKHSFTLLPQRENSKFGTSILQWYSVDSSTDTSDYVLYVSVSVNTKLGWSCPVRVDKNLVRRSIAVQNQEQSIPIVLTSQEHKGQIYLSLHQDLHPQLLIDNRSGVRLFCVQFSGSDSDIFIPDCEHLKWMCCVQDGQSTYYTMPTLSEKFPDLTPRAYKEKLILASDPEGDPQGYQWSNPISLTNYNDQFVRIPYYGDVKVIVVDTSHTIFIVIESVSQVEISARDIRVRLSMHENETQMLTSTSKKESDGTEIIKAPEVQDSQSDTTLSGSYFSAEDLTNALSETHFQTYNKYLTNLSTLKEVSTTSTLPVPSFLQRYDSTLRPVRNVHFMSMDPTALLKISVFIKSVTLTFTSNLESNSIERTEIASFTCDNIAFSAFQTEVMHICVSVTDMQLDNQLYNRGGFDFPVVLIGQEKKSLQKFTSLNASAIQWIEAVRPDSLIKIDLVLETWRDVIRQKNVTDVNKVKVEIAPLSAFIEDVYVTRLMDYLKIFVPTKLVLWPDKKDGVKFNLSSVNVGIPEMIMWESFMLAKPLTLKSILIEPLSLSLSVHSSVKIYIALDQSPLQFGKFERRRVMTTSYRLGHALTMHYLSGAIFGAGWVVGSLELLGSPGGLARAMGSGLRDFVSLPYQGLIQGPWAFLRGVTHGSASLMKHVTAGTLQSVTKLASSVARNLDRLSLDEEHLRRTEEQRRHRPQGFTQGFMQGLTGLGISLLGAVGGIAHHPLQSVMQGPSPRSLAAGVGLGLVGVFTKPLSGAAELVALTGQGLLQGAGWNPLPEPRMNPVLSHVYSSTNSVLKYNWKFLQSYSHSNLLFVTEATFIKSLSHYEAVALILTKEALIIINTDEDVTQRVVSLTELCGVENSNDPTLLSLKLKSSTMQIKSQDDECVIDMDPDCRARVADYVRSTVGLIQMPDDISSDQSEMGISPIHSPKSSTVDCNEQTLLTFYVSAQSRNYFLCLLSLAQQQCHNDYFTIL